jgi:hypothetical protein
VTIIAREVPEHELDISSSFMDSMNDELHWESLSPCTAPAIATDILSDLHQIPLHALRSSPHSVLRLR